MKFVPNVAENSGARLRAPTVREPSHRQCQIERRCDPRCSSWQWDSPNHSLRLHLESTTYEWVSDEGLAASTRLIRQRPRSPLWLRLVRVRTNTVDLGDLGLACEVVAFLAVHGGSVAGIMRGFSCAPPGLPPKPIPTKCTAATARPSTRMSRRSSTKHCFACERS